MQQMYLIVVHVVAKIISCSFGEIELKTSNFIVKFGITSLFLLGAVGLSGCDISPEKHHDLQMQTQPFGGDRGALL